jgi:hypothetical protein
MKMYQASDSRVSRLFHFLLCDIVANEKKAYFVGQKYEQVSTSGGATHVELKISKFT